MKILYITTRITASGGVARILSQRLSTLVEQTNCELVIVSTNDATTTVFYSFDPQIQMHFIEGTFKSLGGIVGFYSELRTLVKKQNPDWIVVADNGFKAYGIPWVLYGRKVIFESHGAKSFLFSEKTPYWIKQIATKVLRILSNGFYKIVVLNQAMAMEWKHENMEVISNYVAQVPSFTPLRNSRKIIAVGRIVPSKGYARMLDIFEKVRAQAPDWSLHIYGEVQDEVFYQSLLLRNSKGVYFYPETALIQARMIESDFLIHTSYSESFALVIAEALSLGRPVVAFDVPFGLQDLIQDEQNGFLIPDGDLNQFERKVLKLIESPQYLETLAHHAAVSQVQSQESSVILRWRAIFGL